MPAELYSPWWDLPEGFAHQGEMAYVDSLLTLNQRRFLDNLRYAGLYGSQETAPQIGNYLTGWTGGSGSRGFMKRVRFNITQSMVDTVCNLRQSEFGRLQLSSSGGDYEQFMIAKLGTMALRNDFEKHDVESKFFNTIRDACVFGLGLMTVEKEHDPKDNTKLIPVPKRVFSPGFVVDPMENMTDGWPLVSTYVQYVSKYQLAHKHPKFADIIMRSPAEPGMYMRMRGDENTRVDEAWVRGQNGKPGRHVVCVTGATLIDEEYPYGEPPFVAFRWNPAFQGWYCQSLADQLMGLQMTMDELLEVIDEAQQGFGHPFMAIEQNSNVNVAHIQDVPLRILKYQQTEPKIISSQLISPEIYNHLDRIYQKGYEIAGINQYQAQAKTQSRMESSKAQRSMENMGDQRHFNFSRQCEEGIEKLGMLYARVAAECADESGYRTKMPSSKYFHEFPWKKLSSELENFEIKLGTVNPAMVKTSEALQDLQDTMNMGELTPTQFRQYLDNPDVQRVADLVTASDTYIDWAIHEMTTSPYKPMRWADCPYADKAAALKSCVQHFLLGERLGWRSEEARTNLEGYIAEIQEEITAELQPQLPPGAQPAQPMQPQPQNTNGGMGVMPPNGAPPMQQNVNVNIPGQGGQGQGA